MSRPSDLQATQPLIAAIRGGDEAAFASLVREHHPSMVRVASLYAPSRAVAEEIVQEAWIGILKGLDGFEGRSSLKTWMFRIVANIAKTRSEREGRTIPFSSLDATEPAVPRGRFLPDDHPRWPRHWDREPVSPESSALGNEALRVLRDVIDSLPAAQRAVITLRDIEGWDSKETCNVLSIQETNQRVLLHRARAKVREALERYLEEETKP